jgi:hypothetical protein
LTPARNKLGACLACAISLAASALLVACGSSSTTHSTTTAPAGQSASSEPGAHTSAQQLHRDVASSGVHAQRPMRGTGGNAINDENHSQSNSGQGQTTGQTKPCKLVSKAEARAIVGGPIATPQEAPLGPTCIYQPLGAKSFITLAVETVDFAKTKSQIRHLSRVTVRGRTAYCGDYGRPTTFVPLARGQVLNITAPCALGAQFAAKALPRIPRM